MVNKKTSGRELVKGIIKENPLFVLMLGTCPALAVTTSAANGVGMGIAATAVLILSNLVISLLRKVVPDRVRIPVYITVIASLVTILQFLLEAYLPELNKSLGIFIPLITVNCIILGRAEAFARNYGPWLSIMDGLGMGIGFTIALLFMGGLREILGFGTFFGMPVPWITEGGLQPMMIFGLPAGGFAIYGLMVAITNSLTRKFYKRQPLETMDRVHYPGSVSPSTDAIYEVTEVYDGPRPSRTPDPSAVPEALKEPGMLVTKTKDEEDESEDAK